MSFVCVEIIVYELPMVCFVCCGRHALETFAEGIIINN